VLAGCSTLDREFREPEHTCVTQLVNIQPEDIPHIEKAREGCRKYYGPEACLVKFERRQALNYWAICRRGNQVKQTQVEIDQ
jgi:hypothetical protein